MSHQIIGQLNCGLCTVLDNMKCNNFLFSSFVTVKIILCYRVCREKLFVSIKCAMNRFIDRFTTNCDKVSFESTLEFLDQLCFDLFFSICSNAQTISLSVK